MTNTGLNAGSVYHVLIQSEYPLSERAMYQELHKLAPVLQDTVNLYLEELLHTGRAYTVKTVDRHGEELVLYGAVISVANQLRMLDNKLKLEIHPEDYNKVGRWVSCSLYENQKPATLERLHERLLAEEKARPSLTTRYSPQHLKLLIGYTLPKLTAMGLIGTGYSFKLDNDAMPVVKSVEYYARSHEPIPPIDPHRYEMLHDLSSLMRNSVMQKLFKHEAYRPVALRSLVAATAFSPEAISSLLQDGLNTNMIGQVTLYDGSRNRYIRTDCYYYKTWAL